ncbi:MAG: CHRD domain-containing protein [Longimicrobiales bacterium]|nr:CHRD domain-containing protein [Longimicrobiales bacterium]
MRVAIVRALFTAGIVGAAAVASCTGDLGPTGPAGAAGPTGATGPTGPAGPAGVEVFRATLAGTNEVPPSGSAGTGTATVTLVGGQLIYRVDVGTIANITAAHIHGPAAAGVNAGVRVNLYVPPAGTAPISFTTTATLAQGVAALPSVISQDSLVVLLRNGNAYANVHTTAFGGGEIRGQFAKVP